MANIITIIRILCSIALLFFPAFSPVFYVLYITAGVSDMVDGWFARRTHTVSELGAKLDTIKDILSEHGDGINLTSPLSLYFLCHRYKLSLR